MEPKEDRLSDLFEILSDGGFDRSNPLIVGSFVMTMFPTSRDLDEVLYVCTRCLHLTSLGGLQRCRCEPNHEPGESRLDCPSGYQLCEICARSLAGGLSRYAWEVCFTCHDLMGGLLPYGRHSFMNRMGVSFQDTDPGTRAANIQKLYESVGFRRTLSEWGQLQAHYLLSTVVHWHDQNHIALKEWEEEFPPDLDKCLKATEGFLGVKSLSRWKEERGS